MPIRLVRKSICSRYFLAETAIRPKYNKPENPGGGLLGSIFVGHVPLASQNSYPIIAYFWSILWPTIGPMLVTFGHYSLFLVYFVANYRPHFSHFWANDFLNL